MASLGHNELKSRKFQTSQKSGNFYVGQCKVYFWEKVRYAVKLNINQKRDCLANVFNSIHCHNTQSCHTCETLSHWHIYAWGSLVLFCNSYTIHKLTLHKVTEYQQYVRENQKTISSPFYWHGITLIPAWISNHMSNKVWYEITYPFLNFNCISYEWISNFTPHFIIDVITYPCWD